MPNFRSLIPGGYYSSTPLDKTLRVTVRTNNPGAINSAKWETAYPGYVGNVETTPGNPSTIFEAPEFGVGAWWELLRRYRTHGVTTIGNIITTYGGQQDYSAYVQFVAKCSGLTPDTVIDLDDDRQVLKFGKAMFRYEAGQPLPWTDDQILCGVRGGRAFANSGVWQASPTAPPPRPGPLAANGQIAESERLALLRTLAIALANGATNPPPAKTASGGADPTSPAAGANDAVVLSPVDKLIGGQALVGSKTMIGVIAYAIVNILKAAGVLGAATPAGQILSILSIAFTALGGIAKIDRLIRTIGAVAANAK